VALAHHGLVTLEPKPESQQDQPPELPAASPPAAPTASRPAWTYFLSPIALVIGSVIISGTVWYTRDESSSAPAVVPTQQVESVEPSGAPVSSAAQNLLAAFKGYAKQIGLDENKFGQCLQDDAAVQAKVALINKHLQRGTALGVNGTPTFFINNKMIVGAQPGAIFDEVIEKELKGSPTAITEYSASIQALATSSPPRFQILANKVDVSDAAIEGNPNAKVMVAEFSDFQCPFCKRWTDDNLARLRTKVGNDVAIAFLHFPITQIHPNAGNASVAAICAGEQGKFWQMHDLLFARQTEWADLRVAN
jgi:protein-disulfide isomerase